MIEKLRIKRYNNIFGPYYAIEVRKDNSWLTICETVCEDKSLALKMKKACEEFFKNGGKCWIND